MAPLFKKRATAKEIGLALPHALGADPRYITDKLGADVDRERVRDEIGCLKAWAIDYATWVTLGDSAETKAVLDAYYSHLRSTMPAEVYEVLYNRGEFYAQAVNGPKPNGTAGAVGAAFAMLCSHELDIEMKLLGADLFVNTIDLVSGFLKSYRIIG
jgi:hypothetical protein